MRVRTNLKKRSRRISMLLGSLVFVSMVHAAEVPLSDATKECLDCHVSATPAIVDDWKRSRHASITVGAALKMPDLQRRVSSANVPEALLANAVGCAECHTLNGSTHKDVFDHNGQTVHLTVTPKDCSTCHGEEAVQYDKNIMAHARGNLTKNPLFGTFVETVNGTVSFKDMKTSVGRPDELTSADSCFSCHGTAVEVKGKRTKQTDYGDMEFLVLSGWPNQGVGRYNPDGSMGSCTSCHGRHQFAIQMARKPYTCSVCHKGPDVPAYKAYSVSRHGNLFSAMTGEWNFKEVPWTVGKDFTAPTCATCHVSLLTSSDGTVVAKRTHQMNDRLPYRLLGLIYSHPHPKEPDTSIIKNKDGLPLPTTLTGEPAEQFLISPEERAARKETLQKVCRSCHGESWVNGHWERFENTMRTTDAMTRTATDIMSKAWNERVADKSNIFDEAIEKHWIQQWLFYANSTRFASAMMGADYGVFDDGRWALGRNIEDMLDRLKFLLQLKAAGGGNAPGETQIRERPSESIRTGN